MTKKLSLYNKKRDFKITPEPEGKVARSKSGFSYLIQKHAATRLHYDFRLELDGVLKSWAVTRGPSFDPADKRLAVETEDHPLSYGSFEGIIPAGEYGGGTVMMWDQGTWEAIGDPRADYKKGHMHFKLHGKRLKGQWSLVLMRGRSEKRQNWLLLKKEDEFAKSGDNDAFLKKQNNSVVTGRSFQQIEKDGDNVWRSNKKTEKKSLKPAARKVRARKAKSKMPEFVEPQLATLSDAMPRGDEWVHEVKFDGYRVMARVENGVASMTTRNGNVWTDKFQTLADELGKIKVGAIIDGEIVAVDESGNSNFANLQQALSDENDKELQYYAFDLLYEDEQNLRGLPLVERKEKLKSLLARQPLKNVFYSEHFHSDEGDFLQKACSLNLEGVVSKLANEAYYSGRSKSWVKSKCHHRQEFVIGGYTLQANASNQLGALLVGVYDGKDFIYAGRVGTGFDTKTSSTLLKKLKKLQQDEMPFAKPPVSKNRYGIIWVKPKAGGKWVKPELICEVEFGEWTRDKIIRHASFQGLREDKKAKNVVHEREIKVAKLQSVGKTTKPVKKKTSGKMREESKVNGIRISHPDRILYPDLNVTKESLAEYYLAIENYIMPHIINRPLSVLRCVEGFGSECFFQRHLTHNHVSKNIKEIEVKSKKGERNPFIVVDNIKGILEMVQMGVLEIHPWGAMIGKLNNPDRIIFDLDPDPEVEWGRVVKGALEIRQRMSEMNLESFVKTTGGKGLHVIVPMKAKYGWDAISAFTKAIAESMENDDPKNYIANMSKEKRKGKIFIDYHRNKSSATAVAAYSSRARAEGTISMPIEWEELTVKLNPKKFTVETVVKYLNKNVWKDYFVTKQIISPNILKQLKIAAK